MLIEELIDLVKFVCKTKAETQNIELKSAHEGCPKRLYDTLSSFSNQDMGGVIIFGIDEKQNFKPVGVYDSQDLQKKVMEQCLQMEPSVRAVFTIADYEGVVICAAEIPGIDITQRPCYYKGIGKAKGSYVRVGDGDLPMTEYELYSFEAYKKHTHDDERVVEAAFMEDLDTNLVDDYMRLLKINRAGFANIPPKRALELMNLAKGEKPTLCSVLNFAYFPQGFFPQLSVLCFVVPGQEIGDLSGNDIRFTANRRIDGTLSTMLDETMNFCIRNMKTKTIIDKKTGKRADTTEYPIVAIREAVVNALVHRDYSIHTEGTPIQVIFFADRLEIHSPGTLYGRMTVEQLGISKPDLRNQALAVMFEQLSQTENRYSGIPTIKKAMLEAGLPNPKFINGRNEFVVILYNSEHDTNKEKDSIVENNATETLMLAEDDEYDADFAPSIFEKDISYMKDMKEAKNLALLEFCKIARTREELLEFLGIKTTSYMTNNILNPLIESGQLKMTIPDKPRSKKQKYISTQV